MKSSRTFILFLGDALSLLAAFFIMLFVGFGDDLGQIVINQHLQPFAILSLIWLGILYLFDLYDIASVKPTIPHLRRIGFAILVCLVAGVLFFYLNPFVTIGPRTNLAIYVTAFALLFLLWRRGFYTLFAQHFRDRVVFITDTNPELVQDLVTYINQHPQSGLNVAGRFSSFTSAEASGSLLDAEIIITNMHLPADVNLVKSLYVQNIAILPLTIAYEQILGRIPVTSIDETWLLHHLHQTKSVAYAVAKTLISMFVAFVVLVATLPVTLFVAIAIKLQDGGPIFITQDRVGKHGHIFKFIKFRSMLALSPSGLAETNGAVWATKNDPRVTPIGRVIRKLHIDEIPQLLNVLRGEMALVGPRPERPEFVAELEQKVPYYYLRHIITPGFTGWAQIKFRYAYNITESQTKFEYDLYYIKNRNLFMDLGIMVRTIQIIFTH